MTDTFLTRGEVATLTGFRQPTRQWDRLLELGLVPVGRGRGWPCTVPRAQVENMKAGVANQATDPHNSSPPGMNLDFTTLQRRRNHGT